MKYYHSPRWTGEILDCSMPITLDTYSRCSYDCLYCFSYFQKSHSTLEAKGGQDYTQTAAVRWVDPARVARLFTGSEKNKNANQFWPLLRERVVVQWGGLADPFDMHERRHGVSQLLLALFRRLDYPLCFSTKAVWWVYDDAYRDLCRGQDNWNCKFSIINLDADRARLMEKGVPSPEERLRAGREYTALNRGGFTLRLRPFIIGLSDRNDEHLELIRQAAEHGATAVSTEFLCLEQRADARLMRRYAAISDIVGYDIFAFYKRHSHTPGYARLNYRLKAPYIESMRATCDELGLRFYVSDAHHKAQCPNGSCCGLPASWNYARGQFTHALVLARERGEVRFSDIAPHLEYAKKFLWQRASGFNTSSVRKRVIRDKQTMYDYFRDCWNTPNAAKSPYKYFEGALQPTGLDEHNDVIYRYNPIE